MTNKIDELIVSKDINSYKIKDLSNNILHILRIFVIILNKENIN